MLKLEQKRFKAGPSMIVLLAIASSFAGEVAAGQGVQPWTMYTWRNKEDQRSVGRILQTNVVGRSSIRTRTFVETPLGHRAEFEESLDAPRGLFSFAVVDRDRGWRFRVETHSSKTGDTLDDFFAATNREFDSSSGANASAEPKARRLQAFFGGDLVFADAWPASVPVEEWVDRWRGEGEKAGAAPASGLSSVATPQAVIDVCDFVIALAETTNIQATYVTTLLVPPCAFLWGVEARGGQPRGLRYDPGQWPRSGMQSSRGLLPITGGEVVEFLARFPGMKDPTAPPP
jgi:hypothetical protein